MYNKQTNEITFPHIISGNILGGKVHNSGCINGGMKMITDKPFNLIKNRFFGGNCIRLGLIKEYGFYACPHIIDQKKILGFYINDPDLVTDVGKKVIAQQYPNITINYITTSCSVHRELTPDELERKKELIAQAIEKGIDAPKITDNTTEELEGLLQAINSGRAKTAKGEDIKVTVEQPVIVREEVPVNIIHRGGKITAKA